MTMLTRRSTGQVEYSIMNRQPFHACVTCVSLSNTIHCLCCYILHQAAWTYSATVANYSPLPPPPYQSPLIIRRCSTEHHRTHYLQRNFSTRSSLCIARLFVGPSVCQSHAGYCIYDILGAWRSGGMKSKAIFTAHYIVRAILLKDRLRL